MLHLSTQLQSIYSKAKLTKDGKTYNLEPEITKLMATSRDYDELVWAWVGWRNVTGREMRTLYDRFVQLQNIGAQNIGKQSHTGRSMHKGGIPRGEKFRQIVNNILSNKKVGQ